MALFEYTGLNTQGKKQSGVLDADSLDSAKERLRKQFLTITDISLVKKTKTSPLKSPMILHFTQDLLQLLRSGLPLYESLVTIEEKYKNHKAHKVFLHICDQVKQGSPLSQALMQYPESFSPLYISMVQAGENSGDLAGAFSELYSVIFRQSKYKKQIQSALVYPAFLLSFCSVVIVLLFLFFIPSMRELLEDRELHPFTQAILSMSNFFCSYWHYVFAAVGVLIVLCLFLRKIPLVQEKYNRFLLKIPIIKTLIQEAVLMRFCRILSVLLSNGVPIIDALRLSKSVMHNRVFENIITEVEKEVIQGKKLSYALKKHELMPPLLIRLISTAEQTGSAKDMLGHLADIYEELLEKSLTQFTSLLQPVVLLILGAIVGVVLLAVLFPLTDISSLG